MFNFLIIYYVIFVLNVFVINGQISDKRLCANQDCTEPVSLAKTLLRYGSPDSRILSFAANEDVKIYSKSAGSREDLWGAEIKGKRGYVPKSHVREYKILNKEVKFLVNTEDNITSTPEVPSKTKEEYKEVPSPDRVQQAYEVIDGTTIYNTVAEDIVKSDAIENTEKVNDNLSQQKTEPLNIVQEEKITDTKQEGKKSEEVIDNGTKAEKLSDISEDDDLLKKFENKDESIVKNVISSLKNWMNDGSGSEDGEEDVEEEDDEDGEVEDEDEEYEDDEEIKATSKMKAEKIEDQTNVDNNKKEEKLISNLKENDINVGLPSADQTQKEKNIENDEKPPKAAPEKNLESLEKEDESEKAGIINDEIKVEKPLEKNIKNEDLTNILQNGLKEAGLHDHSTTEQPNYEIPPPIEALSDEVTPNPIESIPPIAAVLSPNIKQSKQETNLNEIEIKADQNLEESKLSPEKETDNSIKSEISEDTTKEDPENIPPKEDIDKEIKPDEQIEETAVENESKENLDDSEQSNESNKQKQLLTEETSQQQLEFDPEVPKTNEEEQSLDKKEEQVLNQKEAQNFTQHEEQHQEQNLNQQEKQKSDVEEDQKLNQNPPQTEQNSETTTTRPPEEPSDVPQDPGIFSGIYSSVFGDSNSENNLLKDNSIDSNNDNKDQSEINNSIDANTESILKAENIELELEVNDEEIIDNNNVEKSVEQQTEPTARDILWGSSIRKEIEEKNGKHQHDFDSLLSHLPKDEFSCAADPSLAECTNHQLHDESEKNTGSSEDTASIEADKATEPSENTLPFESEKYTEQDNNSFSLEFPPIAYEALAVLIIVAVTVVIFLWGHMYIERSRQEGPLIAKINNLDKQFLISKQENELLTQKITELEEDAFNNMESVSNEVVQSLKDELLEAHDAKIALEEQVQILEKELENSTEVGLELNRMLSNILSSENGSDMLIANIEQLQRQLIEQQGTINTYNENLSIKETENHELRLELEISNTKVTDLQSELNKMALNLLKIEEDKEQSQSNYEAEISSLKEQIEKNSSSFKNDITKITEELKIIKQKHEQAQRDLDIKTNEYLLLKENIKQVEKLKNNDETLKSLLDISSIKAELLQLRKDKQILAERLEKEIHTKGALEKQVEISLQDAQLLKTKYDDADREKLEAQTKLEVLSNYFKDREAQLQKELNKQESMWIEKQGEATSTIERIKYMQEELQNYKAQYESLKQEIVAQEVQMKSQISILEKKAHENWVTARQAERRLEDAKQEAAQLRNRLTLRERNLNDEKTQNRLQSPLEQNGELPVSPLHMTNDTAASPPLLYGTREHLTTSPPLPGLPPFLPPPPPGVPFMPPPLGGGHMPLPPGFLPPPPSMMPGDHRPPPLGRMSSPPLNSRYSPDRVYSPYSRNSPSPTSDDDYGRSSPPPPIYRGYSPYSRGDERRDFNRPPPPPIRGSNRNNKGVTHSSGSANSNESLEKLNRHNSKV